MIITPHYGDLIRHAGLFSGVAMDAYHGQLTVAPSLSKSGAWTIFDQSPAHYYDTSYLNPERNKVPESEAFILGRAAHHLLLGEAEFSKHFVLRPETYPPEDKPWNGNATWCKQWLKAMRDTGRTVLTPAQIATIHGMSGALAGNRLVRAGALNGLVEHTMVWCDKETGVWIKVRPDVIPTNDLDFADLKSCVSVTDDAIDKTIGEFGYNVQAAMVAEACRNVLDREMTAFSLVFVEKRPPHCVRVKTLKPADLELGEKQARAAIRMFAQCLERGRWPGPGGEQQDAEYAEIKSWRRREIGERIAAMEMEMTP